MATTYTELKNEVADWLARSDLTSDIPNFIYKAEQRINRKLNIVDYEAVEPQTTVAGQTAYPLPADYKAMRACWMLLASGEKVQLTYRTPDVFAAESNRGVSFPSTYTIIGTDIHLGPGSIAADQTLEIQYLGMLVHLSDSVPTNWILQYGDDCMLWGALVVAMGFDKNVTGKAAWKTDFDESLIELEQLWDNYRFAGGGLVMVTE